MEVDPNGSALTFINKIGVRAWRIHTEFSISVIKAEHTKRLRNCA